MADEDVEYEIREVLNERRRGKAVEYLIDWKPSNGQNWDPTWEPAPNVSEGALTHYKEKKKNNAKKKKRGRPSTSGGTKKRGRPAKSTNTKKKKKDVKENEPADDANTMEDDDDDDEKLEKAKKKDEKVAEVENNDEETDDDAAASSNEAEPKSKRQKVSKSPNAKRKEAEAKQRVTPSSSNAPLVNGETTEEAKVPTSDAYSSTNGLHDDDDASLYPKEIVHFVPSLSDIALSACGLKSDSRLVNLQHYYGEQAVARFARVLRHDPDSDVTEEVFESDIGLPLSDLLLRGVFAIKQGVPKRYVKRLRACTAEILSMVEEKYSSSHRLAGGCKNIYDVSTVELAEVQKRGSTLDFSLNWWREHYPVLNRVAYHAQWYRTVIKALGYFFDCKMKCEWIGLLHSPPGSKGQVIHRDGRTKSRTPQPASSSSSSSSSTEESKASTETDDVDLFMSPHNTGVPRVPTSITVCVPLCDIKAIAEDAMADDADLPEENSCRRHNGGTELFLSSHMSEFLTNVTSSSTSSSSSTASSSSSPPRGKDVALHGPFPKTVVTANAGACLGWGFDFAHNGGPNASTEARQVMYFVYHVPGTAHDDENIKQYKDAKAAGSTLFMGNYSTKEDFIP